MRGDGNQAVMEAKAKIFWLVLGIYMYVMPWSHPDISKTLHGVSRRVTVPIEAHISALKIIIKYVVFTEIRG